MAIILEPSADHHEKETQTKGARQAEMQTKRAHEEETQTKPVHTTPVQRSRGCYNHNAIIIIRRSFDKYIYFHWIHKMFDAFAGAWIDKYTYSH